MYLLLSEHTKLYARNKPHLAFWCATMLLASFRTAVCSVAMASGEAHVGLRVPTPDWLGNLRARSNLVKLGACASLKSNSHATALSTNSAKLLHNAQSVHATCNLARQLKTW